MVWWTTLMIIHHIKLVVNIKYQQYFIYLKYYQFKSVYSELSDNHHKHGYIIVGFQTNRSGSQVANPSIFDHCSLRNTYVLMNQNRYPGQHFLINSFRELTETRRRSARNSTE